MSIKKAKYGTKELERDFGKLSFGRALEGYRLGEEYSQKDFAKSLGISPSSLCDLEKGRKIPTPDRAARIADTIGEPREFWVQLALQDYVNGFEIDLKVKVA